MLHFMGLRVLSLKTILVYLLAVPSTLLWTTSLVGPIHPEEYTRVTGGKVTVKAYTQIGANVLVFPNLTIGEGCVVGAYSMVRKDLAPWGVYYGLPVQRAKDRSKEMLKYCY